MSSALYFAEEVILPKLRGAGFNFLLFWYAIRERSLYIYIYIYINVLFLLHSFGDECNVEQACTYGPRQG